MPSGFSAKSIVASETILLSSVIANRWKACSRGVPGGSSWLAPRWASRLVAAAKALRPVSVNCIDTIGSWVCWSVAASGLVISAPESSASSSSTKYFLIRAGWFLARSASTTTTPWGTFSTWLPCGGPPSPSARSSLEHSVPLA